MRGGATDVRRLYMFKDAYSGKNLSFPVRVYDMGDAGLIHSKDIARQFVEQTQSGSVTTTPFDPDPTTGKNMWEITNAETSSNPQHILQYPKDLDEEVRHGLGVNDDVVTSESTGSWNGKGMSFFSFMVGRDDWGGRRCDRARGR